ncbi:Spy/CpxP family protein refolding chaperone [Edaphobacter albus]|uniref:Spy/CpxP family protein refolding chaperone n=1 Tax=Edaphobacter sp. 4G125 TaxID=2763071 RepID=UPI001648FB70|nr:periplasmic heavy metal sensor [Edaphobacter sp. 4G125]QNI35236.1 periplasmic heavy metal sensor [Edaphobacter sp. 4G125]
MKRKVFIGVAVVLVLLTGFFIARAEGRGWHRGFGHRGWHHGPGGYVARELHLTDTQRQQIRTIWEGERPALSKLAKQFADENRDLTAATAKGTGNEAEVSKITGLQGATLGQLILEKEHLKAKIYADVLSQEQRDKADALLSRWQSHLDELGKM